MQDVELTEFGKYAGKLEQVRKLIEFYCKSKYPLQKNTVIKKLIFILDDCPFYITDLLVADAIRQLKIETPLAVQIVADRYKEITRSLMGEVREMSECLEQKM